MDAARSLRSSQRQPPRTTESFPSFDVERAQELEMKRKQCQDLDMQVRMHQEIKRKQREHNANERQAITNEHRRWLQELFEAENSKRAFKLEQSAQRAQQHLVPKQPQSPQFGCKESESLMFVDLERRQRRAEKARRLELMKQQRSALDDQIRQKNAAAAAQKAAERMRASQEEEERRTWLQSIMVQDQRAREQVRVLRLERDVEVAMACQRHRETLRNERQRELEDCQRIDEAIRQDYQTHVQRRALAVSEMRAGMEAVRSKYKAKRPA
eukprot:NODE_3011_length_1066_cov_55.167158_g2763_i0.p1 GENE.NODE_3011_length_1066_cov_55.167158_g2763_i0~~NODE_3011_length_1066_cov_55.167158_g2763_i0.p1  ORF type:complete len:307 (-),score=91.31 NODE_3011_length_1066_cov_55.167158_g2763_i0:146-955(-)